MSKFGLTEERYNQMMASCNNMEMKSNLVQYVKNVILSGGNYYESII